MNKREIKVKVRKRIRIKVREKVKGTKHGKLCFCVACLGSTKGTISVRRTPR